MAIEQFGQSLLSQQRRRQQDIAKRQRRERRDVALGTLAGAIGNTYLQNQAEAFLNNEANAAARINYKKHLNAASTIIDDYTEATKTAGGVRQYLINKRANFLQQDAETEWADKIGEYSQGDLNKYYQQEAAAWADANIDNFKSAYNSALEMGTMEEFETAISKGYEGPANMADLLVRGVTGFFKGKSPTNARASVANKQRDSMLQAGKNIEAFNAAINNGWDIDSAEKLQAAVDREAIKKKERKFVSSEDVTQNISSYGGTYTVTLVKTTYQEPDGSLKTELTYKEDDEQTKEYLDFIREAKDTDGIVTSGNPVTTKREGYDERVTEYKIKDRLGNEKSFFNVEILMGEGPMGVAQKVTDADRDFVRKALTDQSIENMYINQNYQDATISAVAEAFVNQLQVDGQQPSQEQVNKAMESLIDSVAVDGRQFLNMFGPEDGQARLDLYNQYGADILKLTSNASLTRMGSKMDLKSNTFVSGKGHTLNFNDPHSVALDFLASYISLDSTASNKVSIPKKMFENIIKAVDTDRIITSEDLPYLQNIYNRLSAVTETTEDAENRVANAMQYSGIDSTTIDEMKSIYRTIETRLAEVGLLPEGYVQRIQQDLSNTNNQPAPQPTPEPVPQPTSSSSDLDLSMLEGFEPISRQDRGGSAARQRQDIEARLQKDPLYKEKLEIYRLVNQPFRARGGMEKTRQDAEIQRAIDAYNQALALINQ